jgi:hypothetical protein
MVVLKIRAEVKGADDKTNHAQGGGKESTLRVQCSCSCSCEQKGVLSVMLFGEFFCLFLEFWFAVVFSARVLSSCVCVSLAGVVLLMCEEFWFGVV